MTGCDSCTMPIEKRISDESFDIQTRTSTIIGVALALFVAGLVFYGMEVLRTKMEGKPTNKSSTQTLIRPLTPPSSPQAVVEDLPEIVPATPTAPRQGNKSIVAPKTSSTPSKTSTISSPPPKRSEAGPYYLQLGAYENPSNAQQHTDELLRRFRYGVSMRYMRNTKCPYKVMLGTFSDRTAARTFRHYYRLSGFIHKAPVE